MRWDGVMGAWACGERNTGAYAWPSRLLSFWKRPLPLKRRLSSKRRTGCPIPNSPITRLRTLVADRHSHHNPGGQQDHCKMQRLECELTIEDDPRFDKRRGTIR